MADEDPILIKENDLPLENRIIQMMAEYKKTLGAAESCTGGLFSARLINVPGASKVYEAGFVTYANKAKHNLIGVKNKTLKKYGAVSKETAKEMVKGTLKETGADYVVAITGIAGPGGGIDPDKKVSDDCSIDRGESGSRREEKPVGLVYIGCGRKHHIVVKRYQFSGNRTQVREAAVENALILLQEIVTKDRDKKDR